jgi:hypothetical protein
MDSRNMVVFKVCGKHVSKFSPIFKQILVKTTYSINKNKSIITRTSRTLNNLGHVGLCGLFLVVYI